MTRKKTMALLAVLALGLLLAGGPALAARIECDGGPRNGTRQADRITGSSAADEVAARAGADEVTGGAGGDVLLGEAGDDRLVGGRGGDRLVGEGGSDTLLGGGGNDELDAIAGGVGEPDVVDCGEGADAARVGLLDQVAANCEDVELLPQ